MTVSIGQISYSLLPPQADPGMLGDNEVNHIVGAPANETINPGRMVQLFSDGVSVVQAQGTRSDTTTQVTFYGFAVLKTVREGTGNANTGAAQGGVYNPGDVVPVLRKGRIFAEWSGTTIPANGAVNVFQSSTVSTNRGKLTDTAASQTAGSEVGPVGHQVITVPPALSGAGNIVQIDVSLPGAA